MPSGEKFETFLLSLSEEISIKKNQEFQAESNVTEVHLNISTEKLEAFNGKNISVKGTLFHALTIHDRRPVCIKVDEFELVK